MLFLESFEVKIACQCGKFGGEVGVPGGGLGGGGPSLVTQQ